ncbi:hypothetical protein HYFRA_00004930 [Hymenoscyphus fraxineus]|uniref:Uncharacterized protein n=1 Tax=Hymenoscyphus fraxineus TaxID=746836 RepID=A0A9N9KKE3_9HELO|nr:hypothetical protein HYFRA_00004930 [Hymenoscyphus fraxineus]
MHLLRHICIMCYVGSQFLTFPFCSLSSSLLSSSTRSSRKKKKMVFYYLGLVFAFIIPIHAGNIIFNSPAPGTTISVGVSLTISWTITVDAGDLTLESATNKGASPKLISSGIDGKSFTWTPTESDLSGFEGSGTVLRLLDRKDSVREGTSGTLSVDAPQKAPVISQIPVVVQSSQVQNSPPLIISTILAPQPTPVIINTIITTQPSLTPDPSPTPSNPSILTPITFVPPPPSTNVPSTLTRSTISSLPTDTPPPFSNSNIITLPSTFSVLFLLLLTFYLYKRAQKPSQTPSSPSFFQRFSLATVWRKAELDTSVEILELAAEKERQIAELEGGSGIGKGKGKGRKKREVAELGGIWMGVELEDTSLRMGVESHVRSPNTPTPKVSTIDTNTPTTTSPAPSDDPIMTSISE